MLFHGMPNLANVLLAVSVAKVVGYSLAGLILRKIYDRGPNFLVFAVVRIVAGFVFGFGFLIIGFSIEGLAASILGSSSSVPLSGILVVLFLVTSRLLIWAALVWFFYERPELRWKRFAAVVVVGTIFSFMIDVLSVFLFEVFEGEYQDILPSVSI